MTKTQQPPIEPQSLDAGTEYVVLAKATSQVLTGESSPTGKTGWLEVAKLTARNPEAAMERYADAALSTAKETDPPLVLQAVASRYWPEPKPYKVKIDRRVVPA